MSLIFPRICPVGAICLLAGVLAACVPGPQPDMAAGPPNGSGEPPRALSAQYRGDRLLALQRFRPAQPAVDSGGECVVRDFVELDRRVLAGYFPSRAAGEVLVNVTIDSAGRVLQYHERRGLLRIPGLAEAHTPAARDSVIASAEQRTRITEIWLDQERGAARAVNRAGGEPSEGVFGLVEEFETARNLGSPGSRAARVVALCQETQGDRAT